MCKKAWWRLAIAVLALAAETVAAQTVRVGSKNFTEQFVLAEIYAQALEASGIKVERKINLGGTLIAHKALEEKEIDFYPEYTGVIVQVVYHHAVAPGQHVVGVEIERFDGRNRQYRTFQTSKFTVVVPENQTLDASVMLEDDSDMAEDFPDDQDGEYDLRVRLRAQVLE